MNGPAATDTLLLFEVAGRRFATRASAVRRVARRSVDAVRFTDATALGAAGSAGRGLVIRRADGEEALAVDAVHGVVTVPVHALPALAKECMQDGGVAGLIEHDDRLLPVIDLHALLARAARGSPEVDHGGE